MHNIPTGSENFVGRETLIKLILDILSKRHWIISLVGIGGIGKTELAMKVAKIALDQKLFDSVIWTTAKTFELKAEGIIPVIRNSNLSLNIILNTVIDVLGLGSEFTTKPIDYKKGIVQEALTIGNVLLVIDNLESLGRNETKDIVDFIHDNIEAPAKVLVTTRLGHTTGEILHISQTLNAQKEIVIPPLTKEEAMQFFEELLVEAGIEHNNNNVSKKTQNVIEKTGYIPLAIEWLVKRAKLDGSDIDHVSKFLIDIKGEPLSYIFDNLITALDGPTLKILIAISLFADSAPVDILCHITGYPHDELSKSLKKLLSLSVIEYPLSSYGGSRMMIFQPAKLFVDQIPVSNDLRNRFCESATNYYITYLNDLKPRLSGKIIEKDIKRKLLIENGNILGFFFWCQDKLQFSLVVRLASLMTNYLFRLGLWQQHLWICETASSAARNIGMYDKATQFSYEAAIRRKLQGAYKDALQDLEISFEYSKENNDLLQQAKCLTHKGIIYSKLKNTKKSNEILNNALKLHRSINNERGINMTLSILARNKCRSGDIKSALLDFEKSLKIKEKNGSKLDIAIGKYDLAYCQLKNNDLNNAQMNFTDAHEVLKDIDDPRHLANLYNLYSDLKIVQGDYDNALWMLEEALRINSMLGRIDDQSEIEEKLSEVVSNKQRYEDKMKTKKSKTAKNSDLDSNKSVSYHFENITDANINIESNHVNQKINKKRERDKIFKQIEEKIEKEAPENKGDIEDIKDYLNNLSKELSKINPKKKDVDFYISRLSDYSSIAGLIHQIVPFLPKLL